MKELFFLTFILCSSLSRLDSFAQDAQFISSEINYDLYNDAACKDFYQSSGFYEFNARITWNYAEKKIEIYNLNDSSLWLNATWKKEVNPEEISGTENNRFIFDPAKNELKMKVLKIFINEEGSFTYKIEAASQRIDIKGIYDDFDFNGIPDINEVKLNDDNGDGNIEMTIGANDNLVVGEKTYYLNLSNSTKYTIYVSDFIMDFTGAWIQSEGWLAIEPENSAMIGTTRIDYFFYYAYCLNSANEYIIWQGNDYYSPAGGSEGSYGFRKVYLWSGTFDEDGEVWYMNLILE